MSKKLPIKVTDHCIVRYLERVLCIDVDQIRDRITADCREAIDAGASSIKVNGVQYHLENRTVVTVTPPYVGVGKAGAARKALIDHLRSRSAAP